jgi:hypothetical protein
MLILFCLLSKIQQKELINLIHQLQIENENLHVKLNKSNMDLSLYKFNYNIINKYKDSLFNELNQIKNKDYFLYVLGKRESNNQYNITNKWGYMGKYQFNMNTLKGLGFKCSKKEFLNNPQLQEKAMEKYLRYNKKLLKKYIKLDTIKNKRITESGILAASHLGGVGNVIKYLKNGKIFKDGLGTPITEYLYKFSGYNIDF